MQTETIDNLSNYFSFKDEKIRFKKHSLSQKFLFLPFTTKMEPNLVKKVKFDLNDFNGIVGEIYRFCNDKQFPANIKKEENYKELFKNQLLENIVENTLFPGDDQNIHVIQDKLRDIVESLYYKGNDIINFSNNAMSFLNFNHPHPGLTSIAGFIIHLFIDEENQKIFKVDSYENTHLLDKLVINSIPELEKRQATKTRHNYIVVNHEIRELFKQDLHMLQENRQDLLNSINHLIKHYYYYYVSSLAIKLNSFFEEKDDISLFFTLDNEQFSSTRKAYLKGWKFLEPKINNLFVHSICLDFLHHIKCFKDCKDYLDIKARFLELSEVEQTQVINDVNWISQTYITSGLELKDKSWNDFESYLENRSLYCGAKSLFEREVIRLWYAIEFQFIYSDRKRWRSYYAAWFNEFCKINILKYRGRNGYSLNMESDNLLFLIKLSIGQKNKIRLKDLWEELAKRGVLFDNTSKKAVVSFLERINLIEKKSDSGDAQYVKAIL